MAREHAQWMEKMAKPKIVSAGEWELSGTGEARQSRALRLIGAGFALLAAYLLVQSTWVLAAGYHPRHSPLGIGWTAITAIVMFALAATASARSFICALMQRVPQTLAVSAAATTFYRCPQPVCVLAGYNSKLTGSVPAGRRAGATAVACRRCWCVMSVIAIRPEDEPGGTGFRSPGGSPAGG
jgi:hypothetical protein